MIGAPATALALLTCSIALVGVHVAFFLHLTGGPDNANNIMALVVGMLIVFLLFGGSVWITHHANYNVIVLVDVRAA